MNIDIPYPQRHLLELEIEHDRERAAADGIDIRLSASDVDELQRLHSTRLHQLLQSIGRSRKTVETVVAHVPLAAGITYIMEEEIMVEFIREGGVGMYVILGIGAFLLGRELLNVVRLLIVKDHSSDNLRIDTPSVLLGCLALMLVSFSSTILGLYKSASGVAEARLSWDILLIGAKESLTNLILSSFICAIVVLAHYATRRTLHVWRAPI